MKKIILLLFIIAGSSQLKAQQSNFKPADSLFFKTPKAFNLPQFKLNDSNLLKDFSTLPKSDQLAFLKGIANEKSITKFYSRMPIAKTYTNDKMPVAKLNGIDRMPGKRIEIIDPLAKFLQPAP